MRATAVILPIIPHKNIKMSCFKVDVKRARRNSIEDLTETERVWGKGNPDYDGTLSIVVVGASGNLAMLKV